MCLGWNMFELLSQRLKNKKGEPEVYLYDEFPKEFRNQVFYILSDVLDPYTDFDDDLWDYVHDKFSEKRG